MKSEFMASCGMNCNLCVAYLMAERKCPTCRFRDKKCVVRRCEKYKENKFEYCYECDIFHCFRIKRLDKRYKT